MLTLTEQPVHQTYEFQYLNECGRSLNIYRLIAAVLGFAHRKIFSAKHIALSYLHLFPVSVSHIV